MLWGKKMLKINLESFSGPMDLLLELLQKNKLDIYDIEISSITEQFLEIMQKINIAPEELSDFIRMASILVQIKGRSLSKSLDEEDDEDIVSKEELIRRLMDYRLYKKLAGQLRLLEEEGFKRYWKLPEDLSLYIDKADDNDNQLAGDPEKLMEALLSLDERKKSGKLSDKSITRLLDPDPYPENKIAERMRKKMLKGDYFSFLDLFDRGDIKKLNLISTFLLLLELSRRQVISVLQKDKSIHIELSDRKELQDFLKTIADNKSDNLIF